MPVAFFWMMLCDKCFKAAKKPAVKLSETFLSLLLPRGVIENFKPLFPPPFAYFMELFMTDQLISIFYKVTF